MSVRDRDSGSEYFCRRQSAAENGVRKRGPFDVSRRPARLAPITRDDPFTQRFVGRFDGARLNHELLLAGILKDQLQSELEILELLGAKVAHSSLLLQRHRYQSVGRFVTETDAQLMRLVESPREIMDSMWTEQKWG